MPKRKALWLKETARLVLIVHELRKKCPWDRKQTHKSLAPYLIEEAFETIDAIEKRNRRNLMEELGDVLLQVVLHSEIAEESNKFTFEDVAKTISDKMIRRHPHVYARAKYRDYKTHVKNWTESKRKEKPKQGQLDGLPTSMPALQLASRYGDVASSIGVDWPNVRDVEKNALVKWRELRVVMGKGRGGRHATNVALGDLLFTLANLARHLKLDPESALRGANDKFRKRFEKLEKRNAQSRKLPKGS